MKPSPKATRTVDDLIAYLLAHRSGIQDCVIIDCLALHRVWRHDHGRRFSSDDLMKILDTLTMPSMCSKLKRLRRADLVQYKAGHWRDPGYTFSRVGPE